MVTKSIFVECLRLAFVNIGRMISWVSLIDYTFLVGFSSGESLYGNQLFMVFICRLFGKRVREIVELSCFQGTFRLRTSFGTSLENRRLM